jgi:adenine specific DNA methylase Mod
MDKLAKVKQKEKDGYFKGSTEEAIRDIRSDLKRIRVKLDRVCDDHERRLTAIESAVRLFKWLYGAFIAFLTYLGFKPN